MARDGGRRACRSGYSGCSEKRMLRILLGRAGEQEH